MKKKLKLAFDQLEMDMDLLPDTELGRYNGGTGSAYGPGDGAAFYNWYVNGGYEYGGSAVWFFTSGGYSSSGSESGSVDNDTEYWIWGGNSWVWMGCGTPDENAPHYGGDLPEVVITVNGNNQSFQNPYTVWYDWLREIGGSSSGSNSGSGYESGSSSIGYSTVLSVLGGLSVTQGTMQTMHTLESSLGNLGFVKGVKVAGPILMGVYAAASVGEVLSTYNNGGNWQDKALDAGIDIAVGIISISTGGIGFLIGTTYYILDEAGYIEEWTNEVQSWF